MQRSGTSELELLTMMKAPTSAQPRESGIDRSERRAVRSRTR